MEIQPEPVIVRTIDDKHQGEKLKNTSFVNPQNTTAATKNASILDEEDKYLKNVKQLTFEGVNGEGYFSPDTKKIIFQSIRGNNPNYQIYSMDLDGSNQTPISDGRGKGICSFYRADMKKILFSSTTHNPGKNNVEARKRNDYGWDFDPALEIYEADLDGSNLKRLTNVDGYDAEATYSNKGDKVVFTSLRDGDLELYVMNSDGSEQKRLTNVKGYDGGAFFSPTDEEIVFRAFRDPKKPNVAQVYIINKDGENERQVTNLEGVNWCPAYHPSGKYIIFSSNFEDPSNFDLYVIKPDGTGLKRITNDKTFDGLPFFSPDGKKLLWTANRTGKKSQLFIADWNYEEFDPILTKRDIINQLGNAASETSTDPTTQTAPITKTALYPVNKDRLKEFFLNIVQIPGQSKNERKVAEFLKAEIAKLGYEATEDRANENFGGNTGNLSFTIPASVNGAPPITLLAHMDTVSKAVGVKPVVDGDIIRPQERTALGGDDRAGITDIIEAIRVLQEQNIPHGKIQVIFTAAEEAGLLGSRNLNKSQIIGKVGFAVDSFKANEIYFSYGEPIKDPPEKDACVEAEKAFKRPESPDDYKGLSKEELNLVEFTKQAIKDIGLEPQFRQFDGAASDALSLRRMGIPAITIGAGEENIHWINEIVRISELERCTQLILAIIACIASMKA